MTDKYADIRAALEAGPTPGPWRAEMVYDAGYAHINFDSREWNTLRGFCGEANAAYIAAAHPEIIRTLLAERDQYARILDGLPQDAIDGGWTAAGISAHAKRLEGENARLRNACEKAIEWLEGWASAEPYLSCLRAALAKEQS